MRVSWRSAQIASAHGDARAGEAELGEVLGDHAARGAIGLDEGHACRAARERLQPERAGAGVEVEHARPVDRADQVEGGLADAVAGGTGREALAARRSWRRAARRR